MSNPQDAPASARRPAPAAGPFGGGPGRGGMMGGGMMGGGEKAKDFKGTMSSLWGYLKPFRAPMIAVVFFAIISTAFGIASPKLLGTMTNRIVDDYIDMKVYDQVVSQLPAGTKLPSGATGEVLLKHMPPAARAAIPSGSLDRLKKLDLSRRPHIRFENLSGIALLLIGLYLLSTAFAYLQGWIMAGISQEVTYRFRRDISQKINRLPLKYFDSRTYGEVLSRITNDVDTVSQTLNQSLSQIVTSVAMLVGILGMMFSISWLMTLVALLILPLSFGIVGVIIKKSQHYFKEQQVSLGHLNGHVEEMYGGHAVMKVYGGEKRSVAHFQTINRQLYRSAWRSQFLSGLMWPIMTFIGNLGYVGISVLGGWLAINGRLQIGDIQAFIQYLGQFNQPIIQTATIANVLQSTAAAAERVFEFLGEAEETPDPWPAERLEAVKGAVEFEGVEFGYDPEKPVIKNFTASIKPGQRVAIVGPTGAGKTTVVNLLMRFYDVSGGAIKVDGIDIRAMKRAEVRKLFAMVLQDTWLFNGTLEENIHYGNLKAGKEEVVEAAKAAHADHFIRALPHGYDMKLNEEADNISQGEKQLLTISRAMIAGTPMLILDEATSSVDTRTEALIQKAMENLMKGKTSFVIAHRLSTIRHSDLILVMRDGSIVEQGKHEELLQKNGFYAELYNSQFSGQEG